MKDIKKSITVLPGDGIGPEVTTQALRVLRTISSLHPNLHFIIEVCPFGGAAIDETGQPLPNATLKACQQADAILLGAIGGPKWGPSAPVRPESGLLALRKALGLYANIRPALFPSQSLLELSPLKPHIAQGTEITVVRELIGGIYFGERTEAILGVEEGEGSVARDACTYSVSEIKRIARLAGWLAMQGKDASSGKGPLDVHSVDKANVLATSRLWRRVVQEVFDKEFPEIKLDHQLVDSCAMLIVSGPKKLNGIVLTENLFGDILSDETSVIPGSLGLLPSASLPSIPDPSASKPQPGLYEPIHGSAPDIAGQNTANPIGTILSIAMMLKYSFGLPEEAAMVEEAVKIVLDAESAGGREVRTRDLGGDATTTTMGDSVVEVLTDLMKKHFS